VLSNSAEVSKHILNIFTLRFKNMRSFKKLNENIKALFEIRGIGKG
jgi:hypothetical protein